MRRVAAVAAALLATSALASGLDQCTDSEPSCASVSAWDDALSPGLREQLLPELMHIFEGKTPQTTRSLWLPFPRPENTPSTTAMEEAARRLYELAFDTPYTKRAQGVLGAEIWAQIYSAPNIGSPHYDKDEHSFQKNGMLNTPYRSTVTYMSAEGGPTAVLHQFITPGPIRGDTDAGTLYPAEPEHLSLVYPRLGRHAMFQGNMWHQVRGDLAPPGQNSSANRVTFLINWWKDDELPEATGRGIRLTPEWAKKAKSPRTGKKGLPAFEAKEEKVTAVVQTAKIVDPSKEDPVKAMGLFVPKTERGERTLWFNLPKLPAESFVQVRLGNVGQVGPPQLSKSNSFMADLFRSELTKCVLFGEIDQLLKYGPVLKQAIAESGPDKQIKPLSVDAAHSYLFLSFFGINRAQVPTVACFDDDFGGSRDVLPRQPKPAKGPAPLGAKITLDSVKGLISGYLEHKEERLNQRRVKKEDGTIELKPLPKRRQWMRDPDDAPSHTIDQWNHPENVLGEWKDFEEKCLRRSLFRRTVSAKANPTACLILITQDKDTASSSAWDLMAKVIGSSKFRPSKMSFEFMAAHQGSPAAERLLSALGIDEREDDFVLALQEQWSDPQRQISYHPAVKGSWGVGELAVGDFGKWVVSLEGEEWFLDEDIAPEPEGPEGDLEDE
eukprot:Hpha_TRINITY_DN16050_c2_g10::TRINITY_DN16050_c2_g10_i1::g.121526::m.121526